MCCRQGSWEVPLPFVKKTMKKRQDNTWKKQVGCAYLIVFIFLFLVPCYAVSGCSPRIVEHWNTEYRDTTIVKTEVHDSLVYVPIPLEKDQVIVQVGDTSKLETSIARSEAFVGGDGFLHHSLENKHEKTLPVIVPVKGTYIYTGVSNNETHTITKTVERNLTWWQRFRLDAFWPLSCFALLVLVYLVLKLLKLIKII